MNSNKLIDVVIYSVILGFFLSTLILIINWVNIFAITINLLLLGVTIKDFMNDNIELKKENER